MMNSPCVFLALNRNSLPDILGPGQLSRERFQSLGPFRENLKHVPVGFCHDVKNLLDEIIRDGFMKEVTHTIDENLTEALSTSAGESVDLGEE